MTVHVGKNKNQNYFPTWSGTINNNYKRSTLDHVYVKDPSVVSDLNSGPSGSGDHLLIWFTVVSGSHSDPVNILFTHVIVSFIANIIWYAHFENYNLCGSYFLCSDGCRSVKKQ